MNIHHGDCLDILQRMAASSVDSLVTDPPAGISFMGKSWDADKGGRKEWIAWMSSVMRECLRVMKPGAHGLVWAIPRTSHWTATALEDAGFEIRDVVTHLFGSGFPKSLDISKAIDKAAGAEREVVETIKDRWTGKGNALNFSTDRAQSEVDVLGGPSTLEAKQWQGWGTALKPASEHWILVRKPCSEKTVAANVLKWGCGGLNIDASRITSTGVELERFQKNWKRETQTDLRGNKYAPGTESKTLEHTYSAPQGRFPANLVLDEVAAEMLDAQSGTLHPSGNKSKGLARKQSSMFGIGQDDFGQSTDYKDTGGASRFFYCAKASKRDKGTENTHPTVKSTSLMSYLIKMITPPNGIVLDPFMGSGSTGVAAVTSHFQFIGIEREADYVQIAEKRIYHKLPEFKKQHDIK